MRPAWLAAWAAADKALPMLYGVALILVAFPVLDKTQKGVWAVFQMIFMIISLLAEFFILQPMVKLAAEHGADRRPIITASIGLYTGFSMALAGVVVLTAPLLSHGLKASAASLSFTYMIALVASTLVRNIAIRILQIDYRVVAIFLVDAAYFLPLIVLMVQGRMQRSFDSAIDMI